MGTLYYNSDHSTLAAAVAAASGGTLVIDANRTISAPVTIPANTRLVGGGGIITMSTASQNALDIGGDAVTIEGVQITGPSSASAPSDVVNGNGIHALQVDKLIISDCIIQGFNSAGIMLRACRDVTIRGNRLFGNMYNGFSESSDICLYSFQDPFGRVVIDGNFCLSNNSQGIFVSALGNDSDIAVANNICVTSGIMGGELVELASGVQRRHGIEVNYGAGSAPGRVVVVGNVCRNTRCTGIYGYARVATAIVANICSRNGQTDAGGEQAELCGGIVLGGAGEGTIIAFNQIHDCRAPGANLAGGIVLNLDSEAAPVTVSGNTINGSLGHGIVLKRFAARCAVSDNEIRGSAFCDILEWPDSGEANAAIRGGHFIDHNRCVRSNINYPSVFILASDSQLPTYVTDNKLIGAGSGAPNGNYSTPWSSWSGDLNAGVIVLSGLDTKPAFVERNLIRNYHSGIVNYGYITGRYELRRFDSNDLRDLTYGMVIAATTTNPVMLTVDNKWTNVTNRFGGGATLAGAAVGYVGRRLDSTWELFGMNAAPSQGSWIVGDEVRYASVSSGGYRGALCTTAGTPGIWKAWGLIA